MARHWAEDIYAHEAKGEFLAESFYQDILSKLNKIFVIGVLNLDKIVLPVLKKKIGSMETVQILF